MDRTYFYALGIILGMYLIFSLAVGHFILIR